MKKSLSILIAIMNIALISAQDKALIDFSFKSFVIDNVSLNSCILSDSLIDHKREIVIFSTGECNMSQVFINIESDIINFSLGVPAIVDTQYVTYDSLTSQKMITSKLHSVQGCCNGNCGYELTYLLNNEYTNKKIRVKGEFITKCKDHSDFRIVNGDTINRLDKFGLKQGDWIEFYPNKKVKDKDRYINGRLIYGFGYDELGNIISRTTNDGETTITIEENKNKL